MQLQQMRERICFFTQLNLGGGGGGDQPDFFCENCFRDSS